MQSIAKIYGFLISNKISFPKYIGIVFLIELLSAIFLALLVFVFIDIFDLNYAAFPEHDLSWGTFWKGVVFAPTLETYLLILTLHILRSFDIQGLKLASIAAIFWGALHGVQSWPWFFAPAWIFFIYSTAYETWRLTSFKKAYFAAAIPHALNNLVALFANSYDI